MIINLQEIDDQIVPAEVLMMDVKNFHIHKDRFIQLLTHKLQANTEHLITPETLLKRSTLDEIIQYDPNAPVTLPDEIDMEIDDPNLLEE